MKPNPLVLVIVVLIISGIGFSVYLLLPPTEQRIRVPDVTKCISGGPDGNKMVRVHVTDPDRSVGALDDEIGFLHNVVSNELEDSDYECFLVWEQLRNGKASPIIQAVTYANIHISDYFQIEHSSNILGDWKSGVKTVDFEQLRDFLFDEHGIRDSSNELHDWEVDIRFWKGSCNSDVDCDGDESCVLSENTCREIDCDDDDPCTLDVAENNTCTNSDIAGCCHDNSECPDDEVCTSNVCTEGCRDIPDRPCDQAVWSDHPTCEWDETGCAFDPIILTVFVMIGICIAVVVVYLLMRKGII